MKLQVTPPGARAADMRLAVDRASFLAATDVLTWRLDAVASPLFIEPRSVSLTTLAGFMGWLEANLSAIKQLLIQEGALIFRGFPIARSEDFNQYVKRFGTFSLGYAGGASPRRKVTGDVFEATQLAGPQKIPLHQEMAYLKDYPDRIAFFCCKPAEHGGETLIADMRRITRAIPSDLRDKLETSGVMNIRNFRPPSPEAAAERAEAHPDQRSWSFAFYTDDPRQVEAECAAKSMEPVWHEDGSLTVRTRFAAFVNHPVTGERIYRSVLHLGDPYDQAGRAKLPPEMAQIIEDMQSKQVIKSGNYLGDGAPLSQSDLDAFKTIYAQNEISWPWQAGDIMLLDNLLTAHGRNPFAGTRNVQVGLLA